MERSSAIRVAINLYLTPLKSAGIRQAPLPCDVSDVLRIAAGEDEIIEKAVLATNRSRNEIQQAASFFIENILFAHDADSYRVLGANSNASSGELRRNMALITRYLHPDLEANVERSIFMTRVTEAWSDLKTPEKRAAYDRRRKSEVKYKKKNALRRSRLHRHKAPGKNVVPRNAYASKRRLSRTRQLRGALLRRFWLLLIKISGRS